MIKYFFIIFLSLITTPSFGICYRGITLEDVASQAQFAVIGKYDKKSQTIDVIKRWKTSQRKIKVGFYDERFNTSEDVYLPILNDSDKVLIVSNQDPQNTVFFPRCRSFIEPISNENKLKESEYIKVIEKEFSKHKKKK